MSALRSVRTPSFSTLKALIRPLLAKYHAWIYQHPFAYNKLDLVPLGYLTKPNPRFHSAARLADEIRDVIKATFPHLSGAIREKFEDECFYYFDDNSTVDPPITLLAPAYINSGDESTRAMEIRAKRVSVPAMKSLLEQVYAIVPKEGSTAQPGHRQEQSSQDDEDNSTPQSSTEYTTSAGT
jgi:hypothetical protein